MAYVVLDLETTGLDPKKDTIIEVGAVRFEDPKALLQTGSYSEFQRLVNPFRKLERVITELTGIEDADLVGQATWAEVRPEVQAFLSIPTTHLVAHNVNFEKSFLSKHNIDLEHLTLLDTYDLAFMVLPQVFQLSLGTLCVRFGIDTGRSHRAFDDALATAKLFTTLLQQVKTLPNEMLQLLLAHSPEKDGGFRSFWAEIAAQRGLTSWDRDQTIVVPQSAAPGISELWDEVPAQGSLFSASLPSHDQALSRTQEGTSHHRRSGWEKNLIDLLATGESEVVLLGPDKGRRSAVAVATQQWATENGRKALLCLPHCENELGQETTLQVLERNLGERPSFLPDPSRYLDLERLNIWKAGRALGPQETRLLAKILHWVSSSPSASQGALFLRHDFDNLVIWPQLAGQLCQFREMDPEPLQLFPPAATERDSPLAIMDHGAFIQTLLDDPNFASGFDAIIVDDIWHLIQNLPQFATKTQTLIHVHYFLDRLQGSINQSLENNAACWLLALEDMPERASRLEKSCMEIGRNLQAFEEQLEAFSRFELEASERRVSYSISKSVYELRGTVQFDKLADEWNSQAQNLKELQSAGKAVLDGIPDFDAEDEPVQGRYVLQLQGWLEGLDAFLQGVDQVLNPSAPISRDPQETVLWMEIRSKAGGCKFNVTQYCGEGFWQARVLKQCDQALFLHLNRGTPKKGGYLAQRLGLTQLPQRRLDKVPESSERMVVLNPRDLAELSAGDFKRALEELLPNLVRQLNGNAVFMLGNSGQRKAAAAHLRQALRDEPFQILEEELDDTKEVLRAFAGPMPTVFCCTRKSLQALSWEAIKVQCVLIERLPFTQFQDPLLEHEGRYATRELNSFYDQTLPICAYNLMRASDLLNGDPGQRTALILLDARIVTKNYGERLRKALPPGRWKHPLIEDTPGALGFWLAQ